MKFLNSPAIFTFKEELSREEIKSIADVPLMRAFQLSFKVGPRGEMSLRPVITTRRFSSVIMPFYYQACILAAESKGV